MPRGHKFVVTKKSRFGVKPFYYMLVVPIDETYPTKKFQQSVSTKKVQLSVAPAITRFNCNVKTLVNADWTTLGRLSLIKSDPSRCSISFRQYLPLY